MNLTLQLALGLVIVVAVLVVCIHVYTPKPEPIPRPLPPRVKPSSDRSHEAPAAAQTFPVPTVPSVVIMRRMDFAGMDTEAIKNLAWHPDPAVREQVAIELGSLEQVVRCPHCLGKL